VRDTNFGKVFEVYSRPGSNDLAYASIALGPHTDNPYREPPPGIQLLHCLVNETRGGLSTLTDSLAAGRVLADEDPEAFALLATTPVRFRFVDADEELIERRCIIRRDAAGAMVGVYYSPRLDGLPLMDEERTRAFHRARQRLAELLSDPRFELRFPLRQGELVMFDNSRVLHGRTGFDVAEGRRHLQGCYIDLDEPRSRYRTLSRRLGAVDKET
jgi:gamma-butyrobetaine dioxygenase